MRAVLTRAGYEAQSTTRVEQTQEIAGDEDELFDVLIFDLDEGDRSQMAELVERLRARRSELRVIGTSGLLLGTKGLIPGVEILLKPFGPTQLLRAVDPGKPRALGKHLS